MARAARAPIDLVLSSEAAAGLVLLGTAAVALVWANSPWREGYAALWHQPLGMTVGPLSFERELHFWVNDGLMTVFFFVVGLEIRREVHEGELSALKRAALPFAAALGGMLVPAGAYALLNAGRPSIDGWGVPMATDIAFAVGVLALLGERVPRPMRVLLLALAVIDDVGAIAIIAVFYSSGLVPSGFAVAGAGLAGLLALRAVGVRRAWAYVPAGVVVWAGTYAAGLHPTLAGVALGLLTPVRAWYGRELLALTAGASAAALRESAGEPVDSHAGRLAHAGLEAISPVERLEHALSGWVAFGVLPLFALANAGVTLSAEALEGEGRFAFMGVGLGLVVGKPLGVLAFAWLATRLRLAALPRGVTWAQTAVVGMVAGIGFTMSIFIALLAFPEGPTLEATKLGILVGSGAAAVLGYALGRAVFPKAAERAP